MQLNELRYKSLLEKDLLDLNSVLEGQVYPDFLGLDKKLIYPFAAAGKRVRGALVLLSGQMAYTINRSGAGHDPRPLREQDLISLAACVEVIHNASLIHDDIFDNSSLRRNKPTVNKLWGTDMAIILGDFLCAHAFDMASQVSDKAVFGILTAAVKKLSLGEAEELFNRGTPPTGYEDALEKYYRITENKTASLMAASCELGSLVAGSARAMNKEFHNFGLNIGKAFQIIDDILDITGNHAVVGKETQADAKNNTLTMPLICAFKDFGYDFRKMSEILKSNANSVVILEQITNSDIIAKCYQQANHFGNKAMEFLNSFPESEQKSALAEIISFTISRPF